MINAHDKIQDLSNSYSVETVCQQRTILITFIIDIEKKT